MAGLQYKIKNNRIDKSLIQGFESVGNGIKTVPDYFHRIAFPAIDAGVNDCRWGRLRFNMVNNSEGSIIVHALASNDDDFDETVLSKDITWENKVDAIVKADGLRVVDKDDFLLYGLEGRYLWILIEFTGEEAQIEDILLNAPGDFFMQTFPEVYREKGSFFHRYISIFSSIYNDFQDEIDARAELLDIDKAPAELLLVYASWLGIDLKGGFLSEDIMRRFLKEAGVLLRKKGTLECVSRICEIVVGESPQIVERALLKKKDSGNAAVASYDKLYGSSEYDVSLIFKSEISEEDRGVLKYILSQFIPARISVRIVSLRTNGVLDSYIYLDENASVFENRTGSLDKELVSDGTIVLQ